MAQAVATGTGFFLGRRGNVFDVFNENPLRELYTMRIPKKLQPHKRFLDIPQKMANNFRNLKFGRDNVEDFVTKLIDFTSETSSPSSVSEELCHDSHCCTFEVEFDEPELSDVNVSSFKYRYVAFNGHRHYSGWGEKKLIICAIIMCNDETVESCGRLPNYELKQINFNLIEITTTFSRFGVLMMPNSLDMNMNPLNIDQFSYDEFSISSDEKLSTIRLLQPHSDLQTFALYAHDYENNEEFQFHDDDDDNFGSVSGGSLSEIIKVILFFIEFSSFLRKFI